MPAPLHTPADARLVSLDAFRGATIALMVLVNTPGDWATVYPPLLHADWHGWTPTDIVFPSFLWIAGVAMTLSFARRVAAGVPRPTLFRQALRRAVVLFALGLFLSAFPRFDLDTLRVLGVLQRIGICYAVGAAIFLGTSLRGRVAWTLALLIGYWLLMAMAPVPGHGAGRLDVEGNFAHYVDRIVLGRHNYADTKTWDPEGIVSTIPAIATLLLGTLAGDVLGWRGALSRRVAWLAALGVALLALGFALDSWLPINKKLWTSSFALFMAGLDFVVFAAMAWVVDGLGWRRPVRPLVVLGMNAIVIYVTSGLLDGALWDLGWRRPLYRTLFLPLAEPMMASLLYAVTYTLLMFLLAWALYRRGWFLRI